MDTNKELKAKTKPQPIAFMNMKLWVLVSYVVISELSTNQMKKSDGIKWILFKNVYYKDKTSSLSHIDDYEGDFSVMISVQWFYPNSEKAKKNDSKRW